MRQLVLVTDAWSPQVNGVVRTLRNTVEVLLARRWHVNIVTPDRFRTVRCPLYPEIQLAVPPYRLRDIIPTTHFPSAVHIATEGPLGIAARRHCIKYDIPFTTAYHTQFPLYLKKMAGVPESWTYAALRRFHREAEAVMVPTQSMMDTLRSRGFRNVALWGRGVDGTFGLHNEPHAAFRDLPRPIWLSVGRVSPEKNLDAFLSLSMPGTKVVIGDGPYRAKAEAIYPDAVFMGPMFGAELARAYRAADVFVFPSRSDTFGLVNAEAITSGVPVAAYPVTGPLDIVQQGKTGWLSEDLREACLMAVTIPKEHVRDDFSWEAATDQFVANLRVIV